MTTEIARRHRPTTVWALLMGATITTTWILSKDAFAATLGTAGTLALAGWKVRLVVLDFMELRHAPWPLRLAFEAWSVVVPAMVLGFYLTT
ncbi:MAG: cytochrome C oxidase subunit IV family protein [Marmoricola sp.]